MEPLDFTNARPRAPRAELGGVTFLPRSIDKFRASLPGGHLNGYTIEGFTAIMLTFMKIPVETFRTVVADAKNEDDVVKYVTETARQTGVDAWHKFVLNREVYSGDRVKAVSKNPWLADHPEITKSLDFLQYREEHGLDH